MLLRLFVVLLSCTLVKFQCMKTEFNRLTETVTLICIHTVLYMHKCHKSRGILHMERLII